jgi:hypothetical protein
VQGCRARLPGKAAGQGCRARLPGKAAGQCVVARMPGKNAGQGCRARMVMPHWWPAAEMAPFYIQICCEGIFELCDLHRKSYKRFKKVQKSRLVSVLGCPLFEYLFEYFLTEYSNNIFLLY